MTVAAENGVLRDLPAPHHYIVIARQHLQSHDHHNIVLHKNLSWQLSTRPQVIMRHLNAAFIALVAACPALIYALPSVTGSHQLAPWRRLSNRIISSIWRASDNGAPVDARTYPITGARTRHSSPVAARYGQDIVLRFSIRTVEEANAIAEAAEDLYLDIWGFCDGWVDIRLAKDVVCQAIQWTAITL